MATNSKLSQALKGNTNAAKNHVKKMGDGAKSFGRDLRDVVTGRGGNNGIRQGAKDIKSAGASAAPTVKRFASTVGAKVAAGAAAVGAAASKAGGDLAFKVKQRVNKPAHGIENGTGASLRNMDKAKRSLKTKIRDTVRDKLSYAKGVVQRDAPKVKAAVKAKVGEAKSAYYTRKTAKMNPKSRN